MNLPILGHCLIACRDPEKTQSHFSRQNSRYRVIISLFKMFSSNKTIKVLNALKSRENRKFPFRTDKSRHQVSLNVLFQCVVSVLNLSQKCHLKVIETKL